MEKTYEEIFEDTTSPEFRKNHIGGSDIGTILGVNPYKSPYILWLEKKGLIEPPEMNEAMLRGKALESTARDLYIQKTGNTIKPKSFIYKPWPVLSASLDGIDLDNKLIYETKCPMSQKSIEEAVNNRIPEHYKAQIQNYLMIINTAKHCDYHVHINESENVILNVYPDKKYHEEIIKKAKEFWYMLENNIMPERTKTDPYYIMDEDINIKATELYEIKLKIKELEEIEKKYEEKLKEHVVDKKVIFGTSGLKAVICEGRSTTDWKKVKEDFNLTDELLNNYSKKTSSYISFKLKGL